MAINVNDPNLKVYFNLDGITQEKENVASANAALDYDLESTSEAGISGDDTPNVDDDLGGKAGDQGDETKLLGYGPKTEHILQDTIDAGDIIDPADMVDGDSFTFGYRFKPNLFTISGNKTMMNRLGGSEQAPGDGLSLLFWMFLTGSQDDWSIRFMYGNLIRTVVADAEWTETGGHVGTYIDDKDSWWQVHFRFAYNSTTDLVDVSVFVHGETASVNYKFDASYSRDPTDPFSTLAIQTQYLTRPFGFYTYSPATSTVPAYSRGTIQDYIYYYTAYQSDGDIYGTINDGFTVAWYPETPHILPHDVRVSYANEISPFPKPRQLPIGAAWTRHPAGNYGTRVRLHYEGFRPARPWTIRKVAMQFDTIGPRTSKENNEYVWDKLLSGLIYLPGAMPSGVMEDARNVEFSGQAPRRRRGFKIRKRTTDTYDYSINAFKRWRAWDYQLHGVFKVGLTLWYDDGVDANPALFLDSGWALDELPSFSVLDNRCFIHSATKQVIWDGATTGVNPIGQVAPATGAVAATGGSLIGVYGYAYTWFDPDSGDETGPYVFDPIDFGAGPSGGLLSLMDIAPADTRYTHQKIYRTVQDGVAPQLFLIATQANATGYTDNVSQPDGSITIGVIDNIYIEAVPPDDFAAATVHKERLFGFAGSDESGRLYWSEPNQPARWWPNSFTIHEGPITAAMGIGERMIVWTPRTTEILESDFVPDAVGNYQIRRTVISRDVGCIGHAVPVDKKGIPTWMDWRGVYELRGDKIVEISKAISNIFPMLNVELSAVFSGSYNHIRKQVVFTVAGGPLFQTDFTRLQTQLVYQDDENSGWTIYELEASYADQFDDDENGQKYGVMDHLGAWKELELYEADGLNNPADIALAEQEDGILSIRADPAAGQVYTVKGSPAWATDELRGMSVLLRKVSNGALSYHLIRRNSTNYFTIIGEPVAGFAADDGYYIGGIRSYFRTSQQDFGTTNLKASRHLYAEYDDLTGGLLI